VLDSICGAGRRLVLASIVICAVVGEARAQTALQPAEPSDDEFIESLGEDATGPVDRRRLAKVAFALAATLDGDKSSVRLLHGQVGAPEASIRAIHALLEARYDEYLGTLARLREAVSGLLDEPDSLLLFHRVFVEGQRACWQLDMHNDLIEAYAGSGARTLSLLSSREACTRMRTLLFQPRTEAILREALIERVMQQEEIRALERDVRDLEDLLDDLREIDLREPARQP
jgi:hypothetical protein